MVVDQHVGTTRHRRFTPRCAVLAANMEIFSIHALKVSLGLNVQSQWCMHDVVMIATSSPVTIVRVQSSYLSVSATTALHPVLTAVLTSHCYQRCIPT